MKVGDLVKYVSPNDRWEHDYEKWRGIMLREIPGTDEIKVVLWTNGEQQGLKRMNLEVVSEGR